MKTAVCAQAPTLSRGRDFVELTKPRISVMVLFTVAAGALLAHPEAMDAAVLVHTLLGTALVAAGASVLNQLLERHTDGLMHRTENRPLATGRMQPVEGFLFGVGLSASGLAYLAVTLHQPLTVVIAGFTLVSYVMIYTPLKRVTTLNTIVGAVPEALPPVIGWTAVTGRIDAGAVLLFLIVFLWQVPHFLAIAWLCRDDYSRAGLKMLPCVDESGVKTGRQMIVYCLALLAVSLWPALGATSRWPYALGALLLGSFFLAGCVNFLRDRTDARARHVLRASLVYLPGILALLLIENLAGW